ncbi:hypothetical protein, partial [Paraburkholderia caribensis]|uniref:hypothetical protein n=1 Tax=Paraburkholderia caribensis TaxID=75105 RepID=UPI001CC682B2
MATFGCIRSVNLSMSVRTRWICLALVNALDALDEATVTLHGMPVAPLPLCADYRSFLLRGQFK